MTAFRTLWIAVLAALCVASPGPVKAAVVSPVAPPTQKEALFLSLANSERSLNGARVLTWDATLCDAARQHSREMAELSYFDHLSPVRGLETPADRWEKSNPSTPAEYTIGENLFYGTEPDAAWGHKSLMASPHHRANLLNPAYTRVGIGVFIAPDGRMWVTQMFVS